MELLELLLYSISFLSILPLVGFVSGDGSSGSPFIIGTPAHLDDVRSDIGATGDLTYYELANDIDMSSFGNFSKIAGEAFVSFDGKGFDITDITIDSTGTDSNGFFEQLSSEALIDNVTFVDPAVTGNNRTGVLAGDGDGTINTCRVFGGSVNDSDGNNTFGGMFGRFGGTANNSYVSGLTINTADGGSIYAGFAGQLLFGATTEKCWSSVGIVENGSVTEVAGFCSAVSGGADINNCFWDTQVANAPASDANAAGKTTAEMQDIDTYTNVGATAGLDEAYDMVAIGSHDGQEATALWAIDDGNAYPVLYFEIEGATVISLSDSITITDSFNSASNDFTVSDTIGYTDNANFDIKLILSDSVSYADSLNSIANAFTLSDSISITDSIIVTKSTFIQLSDSIGFTDSIKTLEAMVEVSDSIGFSDSLASIGAEMTVTDSISISDSLQQLNVEVTLSDSVSFTDSIIVKKRSDARKVTIEAKKLYNIVLEAKKLYDINLNAEERID